MTIKVVVFDWDGVVVDSLPTIYRGIRKICQVSGIEVPPVDLICDLLYAPFGECFRKWGIEMPLAEIWPIYNLAQGEYDPPLFPGTLANLRRLSQQFILAILSANLKSRVEGSVDKYGIRTFFRQVACVDDHKAEELMQMAEHFDCHLSEVAFVGDMISDMTDGVKAGVHTVGFSAGYGTSEKLRCAGAEYVIGTLAELPAVLSQF